MGSIVVNGLSVVCPGVGVEQRAEVFSRISSEQVWKDKGSQGRVGFLGEELEMVRRVRQTIPHSLGKKVGTAILSACIPVLAAEQTCRKG